MMKVYARVFQSLSWFLRWAYFPFLSGGDPSFKKIVGERLSSQTTSGVTRTWGAFIQSSLLNSCHRSPGYLVAEVVFTFKGWIMSDLWCKSNDCSPRFLKGLATFWGVDFTQPKQFCGNLASGIPVYQTLIDLDEVEGCRTKWWVRLLWDCKVAWIIPSWSCWSVPACVSLGIRHLFKQVCCWVICFKKINLHRKNMEKHQKRQICIINRHYHRRQHASTNNQHLAARQALLVRDW